MQIIKGNRTAFFDCDDTLVMWDKNIPEEDGAIVLDCAGYDVRCRPHLKHIEALKRHHARGHTVIVWSAGGYEWALQVVQALGLEECVDAVMCKPSWWYDDLQADEVLRTIDRIYYND